MKKNNQVFLGKVTINDFDQYISVRGDIDKPLLLILHGGPGSPCMTMFRKKNKPLLNDFLVVTWDQRGTGRSYTNKMDKSLLTVDQIVSDTHQVTKYLKNKYSKEKIFLMGHSFGATVGLKVVSEHPQDYHAYLGVSQFINTELNEKLGYDWLMKNAQEQNDTKALKILSAIGEPDAGFYKSGLKGTIKAKQLVEKYKGSTYQTKGMYELFLGIFFGREYGGINLPRALKGINVSLSTIGFTLKGIDYPKTIPELKLPVYFFSGDYDMLTPQTILREYFNELKAPKKELFIFENSAHNLLWEESDKFHKIVHDIAQKHA